MLAVPLMALYIPPLQAAAIMLPILCLMDAINAWHYRRQWHKRNIAILLPASLAGVLIGALTFRYLSDAHIRIIIGVIAAVFSVHF
ncbi:MAG TPA: sulfite exporter TauE/SafE family protein, partial [Gammaproteobacteria bacterium]|nr:sulfite exporter TauE/SafE family protein [Gammaproteobacteria bacterium]